MLDYSDLIPPNLVEKPFLKPVVVAGPTTGAPAAAVPAPCPGPWPWPPALAPQPVLWQLARYSTTQHACCAGACRGAAAPAGATGQRVPRCVCLPTVRLHSALPAACSPLRPQVNYTAPGAACHRPTTTRPSGLRELHALTRAELAEHDAALRAAAAAVHAAAALPLPGKGGFGRSSMMPTPTPPDLGLPPRQSMSRLPVEEEELEEEDKVSCPEPAEV